MKTRRIALALVFGGLAAACAAQEDSYLWSFDREPAGRLPARFAAAPGWAVAADAAAPTLPNVLAADASGVTNATVSLCLLDKVQLDTGQVWARLNVQSGAAGVVFRLRAPDSFCMLTVTPQGNRLALTSVRAGVAAELGNCVLKTTFGRWHRIGVELDGRSIKCYFDGELKLTAQDDLLLSGGVGKGGAGLVVTAGGRTQFDDLTLELTPPAERDHAPEQHVEVVIATDRLYFKGSPVTLTELTDQLTARFDKTQRLVLRVDKNVDYERVEQVMKAGGAVGFEKISLELRK